jgi:cytochrome oxidase assembly protein ShyY1
VYRFLLQRRWVALTVLALVAVPTCVALGQWQLHRYHQRHAANQVLHRSMNAAPVPVEQLTGPDRDVTPRDRWRAVVATGTYDTQHELLARNRSQDGRPGFYVVTPLRTASGTAVLVNRGWVGLADTATARPDVPAPPAGDVTVTGRIRPSETRKSSGIRDRAGAPAGQIYLISTETISAGLPYPLDRAIVELTGQQPAARTAPEPVPPPEDQDEGMNLSYFVQWNLFAAAGVVTWVLLVWREVRSRRRALAGDTPETGPATAPDPGAPARR